jgi:hypothetical protein
MWYGDTVWPTLVALGTVAMVSGIVWWDRRKPALLIVALLCIPAAIGAIVIERRIVTHREILAARIARLVEDFERQDSAAVENAISSRSPELRLLAANALGKVRIENVRVTDVNVEISGEEVLRARTHFRVTADVVFSGVHRMRQQPTRWMATWEEETDDWRILDIEQLHYITGEPIQEARQYVN